MDIHYITFRTIVQATESEERVRTALSLFLFNNEIEPFRSEGHFGNPITILQSNIKGRDCQKFLDLLRSSLSEKEKLKLIEEIEDRVDTQCCLHIRLDKQAAFGGKIQLATTHDTIAVKIKIKAYPAHFENAVKVAKKIF